jgi:16S rRNA (uracil1498-N3)-methyltransferase
LFLVEPGELPVAGVFQLTGSEGRHAAKVRRMRVGERLELGDGAGTIGEAVVTEVLPEGLLVAVQAVRFVPEPTPRLVVAQALPKGDRAEAAVEMMTEVGVDAIVPWAAARSVVQWSGERGERARARWAAHAREAAKQASRARVPGIEALVDTKALAARIEKAALAVVLHESATDPLTAVPLPEGGEVLLVVGPEGGVADEELTAFQKSGARVCRLGPEVLRTSTAGVVALAVISARTRRWHHTGKTLPDRPSGVSE